jgi:hypothetical protein
MVSWVASCPVAPVTTSTLKFISTAQTPATAESLYGVWSWLKEKISLPGLSAWEQWRDRRDVWDAKQGTPAAAHLSGHLGNKRLAGDIHSRWPFSFLQCISDSTSVPLHPWVFTPPCFMYVLDIYVYILVKCIVFFIAGG